jgi:two-component system, LytTR family, response regulator
VARILIADDSAAFRALAARLLRVSCHEVVGEAADGATALLLADRLAPDAVLLDVHLGADDGHAVARALRGPRPIMVSSEPAAGVLAKEDLAASVLGGLLV